MPTVQVAAAVGAHKLTAKVAPSEDLLDGLAAVCQPESQAIPKAPPTCIAEAMPEEAEGEVPDYCQPAAGSVYAIEPSGGADKISTAPSLATALEVRA